MPNPEVSFKHHKQRGEWAEMRFMARVSESGMTVTRPWGDSAPYDLIVECQGCWLRVQVKSSMYRTLNSYYVDLSGNRARPYTRDDFDFLAALIIPEDVWYVIPVEVAIHGTKRLCLTPGSRKARYEPYREAWQLLKEKRCSGNAGAADLCFRRGCDGRLSEESTFEFPTQPKSG